MCTRKWYKLHCPSNQIQLQTTLTGGQSFRWKKLTGDSDEYLGVMANCLWLFKQTEEYLMYKVLGELPYPSIDSESESTVKIRMKVDIPKVLGNQKDLLYDTDYYESILKSYFRLDVDLEEHYKSWSNAHQHFAKNSGQFYAVRMLDQDPVENLFSFICSQNNHINRISSLVDKLCTNYGTKICEYQEQTFYAFPEIIALSNPKVEAHLRLLGFGYRAKFIQKSAEEILSKGGLVWFKNLQDLNYKEAHSELMSLTGIGPKVADCICLMSLNHLDAIPVDTHVIQIAKKNYLPHLEKMKSMTPKLYTEIGDKFRELYGPLAGWAQTVLFCADLTKFKENSPVKKKKKKCK